MLVHLLGRHADLAEIFFITIGFGWGEGERPTIDVYATGPPDLQIFIHLG